LIISSTANVLSKVTVPEVVFAMGYLLI